MLAAADRLFEAATTPTGSPWTTSPPPPVWARARCSATSVTGWASSAPSTPHAANSSRRHHGEPARRPPTDRALHLLRELVRFKRANRVLTLALENAGSEAPIATSRTRSGTRR
ncbi:hypothetical protein V2I01_32035 [Micromonospora sp. BRA006-A]|nr:hypothetical protein [Micromonospora sp. BRA006-A]